MRIEGAVALVTGAGRGIGRAVCREFSRRGAAGIVVADLDAAAAEATAAELGGLGLGCDVGDPAALHAVVAAAERRYGRVDLLLSNAGFGVQALDLDDALSESDVEWQRMWDVHVMAHVHAARALVPRMTARPEGGWLLVTASAQTCSTFARVMPARQ